MPMPTYSERVHLYLEACKNLGLDPKTFPLEFVLIDGELHLVVTPNEKDRQTKSDER